MLPRIHLIRHAEGYHNIPPESRNSAIHDAHLTPAGADSCRSFAASFPPELRHVDLVCASPLHRALSTALLALAPVLGKRAVLALPDAQEANGDPSNTGTPLEELRKSFEEGAIDWSEVEKAPYWYRNVGKYDEKRGEVEERARQIRRWLRGLGDKGVREVAVVGHGMFWHFVTGNIDGGAEASGEDGPEVWMEQQTGTYWTNLMWRSFDFASGDEEAKLVETQESVERIARLKKK